MEKNVGLWIDHREAVIVSLTRNGETTRRINSYVEKRAPFDGRAHESSAEDQRDRRLAGHLRMYYDTVVACVRDAGSILIIGPGEAKGEFKSHLVGEALGDRVVGVESADKMTDGQLAAKVREHFAGITGAHR